MRRKLESIEKELQAADDAARAAGLSASSMVTLQVGRGASLFLHSGIKRVLHTVQPSAGGNTLGSESPGPACRYIAACRQWACLSALGSDLLSCLSAFWNLICTVTGGANVADSSAAAGAAGADAAAAGAGRRGAACRGHGAGDPAAGQIFVGRTALRTVTLHTGFRSCKHEGVEVGEELYVDGSCAGPCSSPSVRSVGSGAGCM